MGSSNLQPADQIAENPGVDKWTRLILLYMRLRCKCDMAVQRLRIVHHQRRGALYFSQVTATRVRPPVNLQPSPTLPIMKWMLEAPM